jgi:fucose 4-O-acetylase-like acetyltransferase
MHDRDYGNIFLFYIGGIVGSLILMRISMFLADSSNKIFDFIKYCGKQSLGILMFHIPAISVAYNLTAMLDKNIGELRHLPPEIDFVIIIFSVIVPALIIKNFKDKQIVKYFCV